MKLQKKVLLVVFSSFLLILMTGLLSGCAGRHKGPSEHDLIMDAITQYESGLVLEKANNLQDAKSAYEKSIEMSPRPIAYYHLALVQSRLGEYDASLLNLDRALELSPGMTVAQKEKVRIQALKKINPEPDLSLPTQPVTPQTDKSDKIVEEDLPKRPAKTPEPVRKKTTPKATPRPVETPAPQLTVQPTEEPIEKPKEMGVPSLPEDSELPAEKGSEELRILMARAYETALAGDIEGAIGHYYEALLLAPENPRIYYNLGHLYQQQRMFKKAYLKYKRAIDLKPDYGLAWNNLGYILEQLSRSVEAMDCYDKAIEVGGAIEAYYNSALLLEKKGQLEPALQRFRIFLEKGATGDLADEAHLHIKRLEKHF